MHGEGDRSSSAVLRRGAGCGSRGGIRRLDNAASTLRFQRCGPCDADFGREGPWRPGAAWHGGRGGGWTPPDPSSWRRRGWRRRGRGIVVLLGSMVNDGLQEPGQRCEVPTREAL